MLWVGGGESGACGFCRAGGEGIEGGCCAAGDGGRCGAEVLWGA